MSSVLCVFEHVIDQIKTNLPNLTTLYTRSDSVGGYAGTAVIMSRQGICASADICLKRTDFSDPQRGKIKLVVILLWQKLASKHIRIVEEI